MMALGKFSKQYWTGFVLGVISSWAQANSEPLVFFNWADYMSPQILADFEAQTGIEVKQVYYDSDESRDEVLALKNGQGFDLILTSGLALRSYVQSDRLAPLPAELPSSLSSIDSRWRQAYPESARYAVPYFWGTLGIAYRQDLVGDRLTSWYDFFALAKAEPKRVNLISSTREVVGAALKSKGYSLNSTNQVEIQQAFSLLKGLVPHIASFNYVAFDETSSLVSGDTYAAMMYNGDALVLQSHHDEIQYVLPSEGSNIWVDFIAISSFSKQKEAALAFIAYINQPEVGARLAEYVYYASPNKAVRQRLAPEFLQNEVVFPDMDALEKSEFFNDLPPRVLKNVNHQFKKLVY